MLAQCTEPTIMSHTSKQEIERTHRLTWQKTCFIITVNLGHVSKELHKEAEAAQISALQEHWGLICALPNLGLARGQIERNKQGNLHINAGLKFKSVWRGRTLENKGKCWADVADNEPAVMRYGKKTDTRVESLPDFGEAKKRAKKGPSKTDIAVKLLLDGHSPLEICTIAPHVYFTHHRSINEMWKTLQVASHPDCLDDDVRAYLTGEEE